MKYLENEVFLRKLFHTKVDKVRTF